MSDPQSMVCEREIDLPSERDLCERCGSDREGAMFACPHCGHGGTQVNMALSEDELREHAYAQQLYGAEESDSWLATLMRVFTFGLFR